MATHVSGYEGEMRYALGARGFPGRASTKHAFQHALPPDLSSAFATTEESALSIPDFDSALGCQASEKFALFAR